MPRIVGFTQIERRDTTALSKTVIRETWVRPNRRALGFGMIPAAALLAVGVALSLTNASTWVTIIGVALALLGLVAVAILVREWSRPRVAYHLAHVEFNLRAGKPLAVPLEFVEAFFLGQGEAVVPVKHHSNMETVTLVARLSRRAEEWSHIEVTPSLGRWCDGYVTIRGMWCEPLTVELVARLNRRLYEVNRELRAGASK